MTTPGTPEPVWVFDHTTLCGNLVRVRESGLTELVNRLRGECPTCRAPLGEPRPATPDDLV